MFASSLGADTPVYQPSETDADSQSSRESEARSQGADTSMAHADFYDLPTGVWQCVLNGDKFIICMYI